MSQPSFRDCAWFSNGIRATLKARFLSFKSAEPIFIVYDRDTRHYGIGVGDGEPPWIDRGNFDFIEVIKPTIN